MLQARVMPCLLLRDGKLYKTVKFKNPDYIGDPVNAVKIYNDKEVDELVLVDISATKEKRKPDFDKISEIASECFMPLAYGGGIRSIEDMKKIYSLGVEKIVICSYAVENPEFVREASSIFGSQSVLVSIDVKKNPFGKYEVYTASGTRPSGKDPVDFAKLVEGMGAGEIFLNSIDKDGTMEGYDLVLIKSITKAVSVPVIVCGGAWEIKDMVKAVKAGASACALGSRAVYQGKNRGILINFPDASELKEVKKVKK